MDNAWEPEKPEARKIPGEASFAKTLQNPQRQVHPR
jgi:hypothetical protein